MPLFKINRIHDNIHVFSDTDRKQDDPDGPGGSEVQNPMLGNLLCAGYEMQGAQAYRLQGANASHLIDTGTVFQNNTLGDYLISAGAGSAIFLTINGVTSQEISSSLITFFRTLDLNANQLINVDSVLGEGLSDLTVQAAANRSLVLDTVTSTQSVSLATGGTARLTVTNTEVAADVDLDLNGNQIDNCAQLLGPSGVEANVSSVQESLVLNADRASDEVRTSINNVNKFVVSDNDAQLTSGMALQFTVPNPAVLLSDRLEHYSSDSGVFTVIGVSGANTTSACRYTRMGNMVLFRCDLTAGYVEAGSTGQAAIQWPAGTFVDNAAPADNMDLGVRNGLVNGVETSCGFLWDAGLNQIIVSNLQNLQSFSFAVLSFTMHL